MKTVLLSTLFVTALAITTQANAAVLVYKGAQLNVDPKQTSIPGAADSFGWRNATPAKPLDIDGDNIIGTDGYRGRAGNVTPSYISTFTNISGGGNGFGFMDDPTDPTGIDDAVVGFQGNTNLQGNLFSIEITGTPDYYLGLTVQFDTFGSGTQTYTLEQRDGGVGGSVLASTTSGSINNANDGYDWAFFVIRDAADGDFFVLSSERGTSARITYGQVAFDSLVPEPASLALLGLGGLCIFGGRRRA